MVTLVMLVGISGSGKSFLAEKFREEGMKIFSSDEIRKELYGNEDDQTHNQKVFETLHKRIRSALKNGSDCVYDATNLNRKRRMAFLKSIQDIPCRKVCVVKAVPFEICMKRDKERSRNVGELVIRRQIRQFELPLTEEGWDRVYIQKENGINYPSIFDAFPKEDVPHDCAPYHYEDITEHMMMVAREILKSGNASQALLDAGAFHDVGKFYTKSFYDKKGNLRERATYYGHENWSTYLYMTSKEYWEQVSCSDDLKGNSGDGALYLIALHMELYKESKILDKLSPECLEALYILKECDDKGRLLAPKS